MKQQMMNNMPPHWTDRLKGAQFGFIAGILIGLVFGWIFHGVISLALRFGMLVLLLLPLILIGWLWFRSQRTVQGPRAAPAGKTWTAVIDVERSQPPVSPAPPPPDLVDVPLVKPTAESKPNDIEAQLQELKQQQERGS